MGGSRIRHVQRGEEALAQSRGFVRVGQNVGERAKVAALAFGARAAAGTALWFEIGMVVGLRHGSWAIGAALLALVGCEAHGVVGSNVSAAYEDDTAAPGDGVATTDSPGPVSSSSDGTGSVPGMTGSVDPGGNTSTGFIFDVSLGDGAEVCLAPQSGACDQVGSDMWQAMGLNCPNGELADVEFNGHPNAAHVHHGVLGDHGYYSPREGHSMVILSTGKAADIPRTHSDLGCSDPLLCPSSMLDPGTPLNILPKPIDVRGVDDVLTCDDNPELVGTGDCSNTLEQEWLAGNGAHDYAEARVRMKVPEEADAFIYEFAFFSAEYPIWAGHDSAWNDMYIAWLESERWTGNISFDDHGHPISINGVFLDFFDSPSEMCDGSSCEAPELSGFAMEGHAGTRWLETTAPVQPGEEIEVVFALFDLTDAMFDTVVVLDNVHWGCTDLPPVTSPQG